MKRIGMALVVAAVTLSGCGLIGGKKTDDQGGTEASGGQAGIDPQFIQVPDTLPGVNYKTLEKGYTIEQLNEGPSGKYTVRYAVVAETDSAWIVEHYNAALAFQPAADKEDYLLGLTVNKADGKVTKAVLGKKGEAGVEVKIMAASGSTAGDAPKGTPTEVALGLGGPFPAMVTEISGTKTWTGTEGELEGVMLKRESAAGASELKELPSAVEVDANGTKIKATKLVYTDGTEMWLTADPVVATFFGYGPGKGQAKAVNAAGTATVTKVGTDAAPELLW